MLDTPLRNADQMPDDLALPFAALRKLCRNVALVGGTFAISMAVTLVALTGALTWRSFDALETLLHDHQAAGASQLGASWDRFPELYLSTAAIALTGLAECVVGILLHRKLLGPARRMPLRLIGHLALLPLGLASTLFLASVRGGLAIPVLLAGPFLALVCWLVVFQLTIICVFALRLGIAQASKIYVPAAADDVPDEAAAHFQQYDGDLLEAGFEWLGDQRSEPGNLQYRRLWANPSRTVYVSATWILNGRGGQPLCDLSSASQTEDGAYFEVSNLDPNRAAIPASGREQMAFLPGATASEVLRAHHELLSQWLHQKGGRPMQIAVQDEIRLRAYGAAWFASQQRGTDVMSKLLAISDPYADKKPLPAPGRPWEPDADSPLEAPMDEPLLV